VWVTPFWEDDPAEAAQLIGVERTLFGSDWPHAEGMAEPVSYADEIASLGEHATRRIMRDNFRELIS
jgi:predicted TIM-barrel fold metal-dependent hydrolase